MDKECAKEFIFLDTLNTDDKIYISQDLNKLIGLNEGSLTSIYAVVAGCGGIRFVSCLGATGEKYIMLSDLKKLPGFNE